MFLSKKVSTMLLKDSKKILKARMEEMGTEKRGFHAVCFLNTFPFRNLREIELFQIYSCIFVTGSLGFWYGSVVKQSLHIAPLAEKSSKLSKS